jgi:rhamnogalacturonyl hydrolase YesR
MPENHDNGPDIAQSIACLDVWLQAHEYRSYDPFDGLNSRLRPLAFGALGRQLLQQGVRRFPINLRPLLGVKASVSSKGFGYLARAYLKLHRATGRHEYLQQARLCLDWLVKNGNRRHGGISWGNHFDYQSRVFYLPAGTPTIVWVAHIGQAFVDAWELTKEEQFLKTAREVCEFILTGLERRPEGKGVCLSYVPGEFKAVHNANVLGGALLARVAAITGEEPLREVARGAMDYTVGAPLDSLWWYLSSTTDARHQAAFDRGADFFIANFFLPDGTPKYYDNKVWPIDIQCASQAIETLTLLAHARGNPSLRALARTVARWTITNMQDPSGYFYFRKLRFVRNKTPTLHWGQATMLHALACLTLDEKHNES